MRNYLIRRIIDLDILPYSVRWKKSVSGIGRMYAEIMRKMQEDYGGQGVKKLGEVMYEIGLSQADEILETLGLEKNLEGCAYTLLAMHRIFGIKSRIVQKGNDKVVIHVTYCCWKDKEGWTPKTCASIQEYETGLVRRILPSAKHYYTRRRSLGDKVCELVIDQRESPDKTSIAASIKKEA